MTACGGDSLPEGKITRSIIGSFFFIYNGMGFGFREYVYAEALQRQLQKRGHKVDREVRLKVHFEGDELAWQRVDMLVDGRVIVETKAGHVLPSTSIPQLDSYLKATTIEVGLLLYFGPSPRFYRRYFSNLRSFPQADPP